MKVLIVEDHADMWMYLSRRLRRRGFEVSVAYDGESALRKALSDEPDILLLDINIPVVDGLFVATALKAKHSTKQIPIIGISAQDELSLRDQALKAGCDDYHSKPIDFHKLMLQIKSLMSAR